MTGQPPISPAPTPPTPDQTEGAPLPTSEIYDQTWFGSVLRPLLIVIMVSSFALVVTTLVARFAGPMPRGFFAGLALLAVVAAVVGSVTSTVLAQPSRRAYRSAGYRAAELGIFLVITRLYVWIAAGQLPDLEQTLMRPLDALLDPLFIGAALVVGLSWFFAVEITEDFNGLALRADEFLHGKPRHGLSNESVRGGGVDRSAILSGFTIRWVTLGLVMILLAAGLRKGISYNQLFGVLRQDVEVTVLAPIIIFFVAGLLLLSHGRLAQLRSRWTMEQTPAQPEVSARWPREVLVLVGGVALVALLLPLGGTFALATILSTILGALVAVVLFLYQLAAFSALWFMSLFSGDAPPPAQTILPPTQSVLDPQVAPLTPILPPWAGGAFFWIIMALLVAYALLVYLRDRGVRFAWLEWLYAMLARRWADLRAALKRTQLRIQGAGTTAGSKSERNRWFDFGRRSWDEPNQQVRHLYLSTLRNAETAGVPRRPGETPFGYAPRLAQTLIAVVDPVDPIDPEDAADRTPDGGAPPAFVPAEADENAAAMSALTNAFVEVRYAGGSADAGQIDHLQREWERLQAALRRLVRNAD